MSLFDSSSKGVKFDVIGSSIQGTVKSEPRERQQTKFGTQDLAFWPNGDPMMQVLVDLQTDRREDPTDDGERTLYVASKNMKRAISDAIRAAGATDLMVGGVLTVQFVGNDPASKNPQNPAKMYAAQYTAPSTAFAQPTATPVTPVQQAPQQQYVQPPAPAPLPATPQPVQQPQQAPFVGQPQQAVAGGLTQEQATQLQQLRSAGIPEPMLQQAMGAVGVTPQMIAAFDNTPF